MQFIEDDIDATSFMQVHTLQWWPGTVFCTCVYLFIEVIFKNGSAYEFERQFHFVSFYASGVFSTLKYVY